MTGLPAIASSGFGDAGASTRPAGRWVKLAAESDPAAIRRRQRCPTPETGSRRSSEREVDDLEESGGLGPGPAILSSPPDSLPTVTKSASWKGNSTTSGSRRDWPANGGQMPALTGLAHRVVREFGGE